VGGGVEAEKETMMRKGGGARWKKHQGKSVQVNGVVNDKKWGEGGNGDENLNFVTREDAGN